MRLCPITQFEHVRIADCAKVITGSTPSKREAAFWGGQVPFVTPAQLGTNKPIESASEGLTERGVEQARLLPRNAVLVCCIGSLGKTGITGRPVVTNQQINAIVFDPERVHTRYGYHATRQLKPLLDHYAPSTTVRIVKKSIFEGIEIPLPPLPEQKRIAKILDAADALRAKRRESIAQLDKLIQATFLDMFGDPVTNPKGWEVASLGDVADFHAGSTLPAGEPYSGQNGGFLYLKVGDLNDSENRRTVLRSREWGKTRQKGVSAPADSVVIPKRGGAIGTNKKRLLGRPAVLDPNLMAISVKDRLHPVYLYTWFHSFDLLSITSGSTVPQLNKRDLAPLQIPVPPIRLQSQFSDIIQSTYGFRSCLEAHASELLSLFVSLQTRAFSGMLA
ncbi:MAG: restriction endonuclease subunit S [Phycisphaeraceae bacterium]